jgi:hypothetical protein
MTRETWIKSTYFELDYETMCWAVKCQTCGGTTWAGMNLKCYYHLQS